MFMKSFQQFLEGKEVKSSRVQCMTSMVNALKKVFNDYDLNTRKLAWRKLISSEGEKQLHKLLQSPNQPVSMSAFTKLVNS